MAKSGNNLVHSHPSHILCLTPCVKARKSFHGVLPCLVMMYHQTNLGCKSFSISEDLVEMIVALTLNIAKWYFCLILWLMMMHHHTKFDWSEILSGQAFIFTVTLTFNTAKQPFHKTLQLMNMHRQTKLVPKKEKKKKSHLISCCLTSTEARWPIRDGDRVGRGWESERLDRGNRLKKTGETVDLRQNNGSVKAVSPRHCPATCALCNCSFNCCAGQSH